MSKRWWYRNKSVIWMMGIAMFFIVGLVVWYGMLGKGGRFLLPPLEEYGECSTDNSTIFSDILGIMIAFLAAISTFCAFFVQFLYNKKQRNDTALERAESCMMNQIQIYRDIVHSLEIDKNSFKEKNILSFHFYEFKSIYHYVTAFFGKKYGAIYEHPSERSLFIAMELFLTGLNKGTGEKADWEFNERLHMIDPTIKMEDLTDFSKNLGLIRACYLQRRNGLFVNSDRARKVSNLESEPGRILFISPRTYKGYVIDVYQGHLKELVTYFKHIGLILSTIESLYENKEYDMEKIAVSNCALFGAQLSYHESGLLYAYFCTQAYIHKQTVTIGRKSEGKKDVENRKLLHNKSRIFADFSHRDKSKKDSCLKNVVYEHLFSDIEVSYTSTFKWNDPRFLEDPVK